MSRPGWPGDGPERESQVTMAETDRSKRRCINGARDPDTRRPRRITGSHADRTGPLTGAGVLAHSSVTALTRLSAGRRPKPQVVAHDLCVILDLRQPPDHILHPLAAVEDLERRGRVERASQRAGRPHAGDRVRPGLTGEWRRQEARRERLQGTGKRA